MPAPPFVLGVDIGGTKLAAGVCTREGKLLSSERAPTEANRGQDLVIERVNELAHRAAAAAKLSLAEIAAVGVGCVGPLDSETGVVHNPPNLPGGFDVPLLARLKPCLGRPVFLDNDANAAALG